LVLMCSRVSLINCRLDSRFIADSFNFHLNKILSNL
jgi:hypothetical protein